MTEYKTVKVESKTKPETQKQAIKVDGKWLEVEGKAKEYLKNMQYGNEYRIGVENGKVVFIAPPSKAGKDIHSYNNKHSMDTQERIMKTACFNMASRVVANNYTFQSGDNFALLYAQKIKEQAQEIYKELNNFLASEKTEEGIEIPMEDIEK